MKGVISMIRSALLASLALTVLAGLASHETHAADQLVTDLSKHQISIRSNFTGTEILIFGAIEADDPDNLATERDVIVVVSGPSLPVTVRRKNNVAGLWINTEAVTFERVPTFYAIASTRPLTRVASAETRTVEGLGFDQLSLGSVTGHGPAGALINVTAVERAAFTEALVRNKQADGLFRTEPAGVAFLGRSLFRATVGIPATVPNGLYTAKVYLVSDGKVSDVASAPLYVVKSGMERAIYAFAHEKPFLYGIFAVVFATFAGWAATLIFKD